MTRYLTHPLIRKNQVESRLYQQVLFGISIKDNALIVLPTGLGKTVIFIMVIAHFLEKYPDSSVVITAPTRPLVNQHFESCINMLVLDYEDVQIVSGETSPSERGDLWRSSKVLIATPQTLRNDIIAQRVDLERISLMCFDEAHRAIGDDPYVLCAEQYAKQNPRGRRLGFTASPGKKDKIFEILENLYLDQFEYMDEEHKLVKPYVHNVEENWIWVNLPEQFKRIQSELESVIKEYLQFLKDIGAVHSITISNNSKRSLLQIPQFMKSHRDTLSDDEFFTGMSAYGQLMLLYQASEMLETQGVHTLLKYIEDKISEFERTNKSSLRRFTQSRAVQEIYQLAKQLVKDEVFHPKLDKLKEIVSEQISSSPESRILIFANYKATTQFLVEKLSSLPDVSIHRFVGQSSSSYGKGLTQKQQKSVMEAFKSGIYNVLVSTSVGEEGLDVAQCDLVIFYDVTPSATRLIQRSGRTGRSRSGQVFILITRGTRDEGYFYASKRQRNKIKSSISDIKNELKQKKDDSRQTNLDAFFENEKDDVDNEDDTTTENKSRSGEQPDFSSVKPTIYVDYRERGAGLMRKLLNEDVEIKHTSLPVGDFLLSSRVAIERKTTQDFHSTLTRGDLFDQLIELKKTFEKPLLLIEGEDIFQTSIHKNAIVGTLSSISVDFNIPIIYCKNEEETILHLVGIAKREQSDRDRTPTVQSGKSTDTLLEEQIFLLAALPNINNILAERILAEFHSPLEFFKASKDEMRKVHGIGSKIADRIIELLSKNESD